MARQTAVCGHSPWAELSIVPGFLRDLGRLAQCVRIPRSFVNPESAFWPQPSDTNTYDEATITRANDSQTTMIDWLDADNTVGFPVDYGYSVDPAEDVPSIVKGSAGVVAAEG